MSRIDKARAAYLARDKVALKAAHSPEAIHRSVHIEGHKTAFSLPEIILGGQDGLVNVLGIILGVTAATASVQLVIVAGLAAAFAESISMAAVAYTSTIAEADYYQSEYEREKYEIEHLPEAEKNEVRELYRKYGFEGTILEQIVEKITSNKDVWLSVMMDEELKLEAVDRGHALSAALIVGVSAIVGSFIPLVPYFFFPVGSATWIGLGLSALALFVVGFYKAKKTLGRKLIEQGIEMMVIGMVSALVGYLVGTFLKVKPM